MLFLGLDRTPQGACLAAATAIAGPAVEVTLTSIGAFGYAAPDVLGVPVWLPALYLVSAPVLGHGARRWLTPRAAAGDGDASPSARVRG